MKHSESVKDKLIAVTKSLLATKAIDELSVREIAIQAQVNLAAINYYFSSKDKLFNLALDQLIIEAQREWISQRIDLTKPQPTDLHAYLEFLHRACIDERGFARTRVLSLLKSDTINAANLSVYNTLYILTKSLNLEPNERLLKNKVTLLFASLISLSCSIKDRDEFMGSSLRHPDTFNQYITDLITIIFPEYAL